MSAGDERPHPADGPASPAEGYPAPGSPGDPARNPALVSFWLLEPVADVAMTILLRPAVHHGHRDPGHVPGRHGCAAPSLLRRPEPDRRSSGRSGGTRPAGSLP